MEQPQLEVGLYDVITNREGLYEGDLKAYFKVIFCHAQNLDHGYHNFRHMFHVTWLSYQAGVYYVGVLKKRDVRNLLVASLFHDFNHSGLLGDDDLNITRAIRGLAKHILPQDMPHKATIEALIQATEYPYKIPTEELPLEMQIIRDADMSQTFSVAWMQQILFGFAREWSKTPLQILQEQEGFLRCVKFSTTWGKKRVPQEAIDAKLKEVKGFLEILTEQL